jgi:choice-of-anchor B domain-containing protein
MKKCFLFICLVFLFTQNSTAQVSMNMTLLDNWDQSGLSYNDVWGYVDGSGTEYAILGSRSKIHFFEITTNNTLSLIDEFTPGATSTWRDFKTYGDYAYACTEGNEGLLVYDLSNLPTSVTLAHQITTNFTRAHNIYIDEEEGKLYVVGSNTQSNGLIIYDVTTSPPTHLASVPLPGGGYVHDIYVRNDTAYASHGWNGFYIWDVATPSSPNFLASYTGEPGYNHSSWVTPDGNTAFYAREVGTGLPMTALDISDYNNLEVTSNFQFPLLAPTYTDNTPHNPFLVGNYLYTSYYEDGIEVFDVSDPANVTLAAYYDTYPSNTQYNGYNGCWGTYPFLPSGKILGSDGVNGLFLLETDFPLIPPLILSLVSQTNVTCNGEMDGTIEVTSTDGTPPYTYTLDGGTTQPSGIFTNLSAGSYIIEVTDAANEVEDITVTITQPDLINPFITQQQNVSCNAGTDGFIVANAVGGTIATDYQYSIDGVNFSPNNIFTNLTASSYILTVRDDNNCEALLPFVISQPNLLQSFINSQTNVDCFGNNSGVIDFSTIGGTQDYLYSLDQVDYQTSNSFSNLLAGNYTLYTLDANSCTSQTTFTISEPTVLEISLGQQTNLACFGDTNGEVVLNGQGGTGNYQYNIDGGNYQINSTFNDLSAGSYDFNIKDENDCIASLNITITSPPVIVTQFSEITQVDCFGGNTGSVTLQLSGGAGNFSTTMNGNTTTGSIAVFQNLTAGTYPILIEDGNNCTIIESVTIDENSAIQLFVTNTQNVTCNGSADGSIIVNVIGGNGGYVYFINGTPNGTNNTFTDLSAGQYSISTMDNLGCENLITIDIIEPSAIQVNLIAQTNESCSGASDGSVIIEATGGIGNFQYTLNGTTNSTGIFTDLSVGNYNVIVLDGNTCIENLPFLIDSADPIVAQIDTQTEVDCFGNNDGTIQVSATGGNTNFTFNLGTQSNSTGFFQNLPVGNYTISITDGSNCETTITTTITQPTAIITSISASQNISCFGENNGSLQVQANGGAGNFNFTLGNETNSTGLFQNLIAGNYNITITDENNCSTATSLEITEPTELTISITTINSASCNGQEGSIQVDAQGGVGNYQFSNGTTTNPTGLFENLAAGIYMISVTDDNNCTTSTEVDIMEPNALNIEVTQTQNLLCHGDSSGSFQLQAMGGTGTINYTLGTETNTTGIFENLNANTYNITVTDDNDCTSFIEVELSEPAILEITNSQTTTVNCFGENNGSIDLNASGGVGILTFSLDNETNTTGIFENLEANLYTISIVDENGCNTSIEINITEPTVLTAEILQTNPINCAGGNNGTVQFGANGGAGNYQFSMAGITNPTGLFENLAADDYLMDLMDENGCLTSQNVTLTEPLAINVEFLSAQNALCNGENSGSISVSAGGGIGQFEFSLGNETNTSGTFDNLTAGSYNITITDENNCQSFIEATVQEPSAINLEILQTQNVLCAGEASGSLEITATGGTGMHLYQLNGASNTTGIFENIFAGTYDILVTDANGCTNTLSTEVTEPQPLEVVFTQGQNVLCNGDNTGFFDLEATGGTGNIEFTLGNETNTTGLFENLAVGTYEIIATDNNMCTSSIEIEISEPTAIDISSESLQPVSCFGASDGSISVLASGGNGNFTYSLGNETNSVGLFESLPAGTDYIITVTDGDNCSNTITESIFEPAPISSSIEFTSLIQCTGDATGAISTTALGGTGDFEYTLGNETNSTGIFENLEDGTYLISIVDQNNCSSTIEFEINEPAQLSTAISQTQNILCAGESSGSFAIDVTGGTGTHTFILNGNSNTTGIFENLNAGTFEVTILDENDCETTEVITLTEPDELILALENTQMADCAGATTGGFEVQASGGMGDYTYSISNQTNSNGIFQNLASGVYDCLVSDENNCTLLLPVTINENNDIELNEFNNINIECFGGENGSISISVSGGIGGFTFSLGNETNATGFFQNLPAGMYNVTATDINDCSAIFSAQIIEPALLEISPDEITNVSCFGESTGSVQLLATGGTGNFNFSMSGNSNSTGLFQNLPAGNYDVSVTDENNCNNTITFEITEAPELIFSITNLTNDTGNGNGSVTFAGIGGASPYLFSLDGLDFQEGITFQILSAGNYIGYIQDANGCIIESPFEIILETSISNPDLGVLEMNVFPNPFSEKIILQMELVFAQTINLEMINISGQTILQSTTDLESGKQNITLDVENNIPAGIYFLSVKNEDQAIGYFKIIKQ